jgi:hypothetical protein
VTVLEALQLVEDERVSDPDDESAELIASLTPEKADLLWAAIIQLKPHLRD